MSLTDYKISELKYVLNNPKGSEGEIVDKSIHKITFDPSSDRIQSLYDVDPAEVYEEFRLREKAIYGNDERVEISDPLDDIIRQNSEGVCAIIHYRSISDYGNGTSTLHSDTYQEEYNLCESERFLNQPVPAEGTAFLIDYSIVVTAAHCIDENSIREHKFVFGFETVADGSTRTVIDNSEIYNGLNLLDRRYERSQGIDWAVIQLDRPVLNKSILKFNFSDQIDIGSNVYCIGHPCGLPKKIALNGIVKEDNQKYFVANIDTYGGNSGSPVLNTNSNLVEGILVRGEKDDFILQGPCQVSHRCMTNNCNGEEVLKPKDFEFLVPSLLRPGLNFDTNVVREGSRIKLTDTEYVDFIGKEDKIEKAIQIIRHYNLNFKGTVNNNSENFLYYLADDKSPEGNFPGGEDNIPFNRSKIEVRRIGSRWKIVEKNHWILDFGENQEDARQAFSIILQYQFNFICFVGRPNPPITYFKK